MHLNVITTLRCNFHCAHCIYECPRTEDIDLDAFSATLDALVSRGLRSVTLTGGEPSLHPLFEEVVDAVAVRGLTFGISSNGWDFEAYEAPVRRRRALFSGFAFSLDGAEGSHDAIRRLGSFRRVGEAIRHYTAAGIPCRVTVVLRTRTLPELDEVIAFARDAGAVGVKLGGLIPVTSSGEEVLSPEAREDLLRVAPTLAARHDIPVETASSLLGDGVVLFCPVLTSNTLTLDTDGQITFCCDVPLSGAVLGPATPSPDGVLEQRKRIVDEMALDRILRVYEHGLTVPDRWCAYCHAYFGRPLTRDA